MNPRLEQWIWAGVINPCRPYRSMLELWRLPEPFTTASHQPTVWVIVTCSGRGNAVATRALQIYEGRPVVSFLLTSLLARTFFLLNNSACQGNRDLSWHNKNTYSAYTEPFVIFWTDRLLFKCIVWEHKAYKPPNYLYFLSARLFAWILLMSGVDGLPMALLAIIKTVLCSFQDSYS